MRLIKKLLVLGSISTFFILSFIFLHFLMELDLSMKMVYKASDPEIQKTQIHLISYADNKDIFFKNQSILTMSAVNRGIGFIYNYKRQNLDPEFVKKNSDILNDTYGAGWWLWKPYLILKTLERVPEGDIVFYADTGLMLRAPIKEYIRDFMRQKGKDIFLVAYQNEGERASLIASRESFIKLNCDEERCRTGHHVWAGIVILRNSPQSRSFIKSWLSYCEDADLLQGKNLKATPYPEFKHHQHDEGILSVLASREADKVYFEKLSGDFHRYIHVHRRKVDDHSLLGYISYELSRHARVILNTPLISPLKAIIGWLPQRRINKYS